MSKFDEALSTISEIIESDNEELQKYRKEQQETITKKSDILSKIAEIDAKLENTHLSLDTLENAPMKIFKEKFIGAGIVGAKTALMVIFGNMIINAAEGALGAWVIVSGLGVITACHALIKERERFVNATIPEHIALTKYNEQALEDTIQCLNVDKWNLELDLGTTENDITELQNLIDIKNAKIAVLTKILSDIEYEKEKIRLGSPIVNMDIFDIEFDRLFGSNPEVTSIMTRARKVGNNG